MREHRLYQADWLMRFYGFALDEIIGGSDDGMLDLAIDPKLAWALRNRERFPRRCQPRRREMLLRVPGFGVKTVNRILAVAAAWHAAATTIGRLRGGADKAGLHRDRRLDGRRTLVDAAALRARFAPPPEQLSLF